MSSSIIKSHSINKDSISSQFNVPVTSKVIPKGGRHWGGYDTQQQEPEQQQPQQLQQRPSTRDIKRMILNHNMNSEEPAEIEQLINMMRNHKVSDDTSSFHFNFGSNTKDFKPLTPKTSPQPSKTSFTLSPEFQFSFSANVRSDKQKNYIEVGDEYYVDDLDFIDRKHETEMNTYYNQHLVNRKILPLPKPRWKRPLEKNPNNDKPLFTPATVTTTNISSTSTSSTSSSSSSSSHSSDSRDNVTKKLKCSNNQPPPPPIEHLTVDNKRKERNWNDNCFTTAEITEVNNKDFIIESKLRIPSNEKSPFLKQQDVKNWQTFVTPKTPTPTKLQQQKTKQVKSSTTTTTTPKKSTNKKKSNSKKKNQQKKEDVAPGGFLSSDVTLFENPISADDWICLFCQYDILMYGLEDTKRKNGYYRRKKEKAKRLKEAELRRLGALSDSEEDHEYHHHHHLS